MFDQLRPHHVLCERFLELDLTKRGESFRQMITALKELLLSDRDQVIEMVEGVDELCHVCPDCRNGRCESPQGEEEAVRKFDQAILCGLGLSYGDRRSVKEIDGLVRSRAPFTICRSRCPWRKECTVFSLESKTE